MSQFPTYLDGRPSINKTKKEVKSILEERHKDYGDYRNEALITQSLYKTCSTLCPVSLEEKLSPAQRDALYMIFKKISRAVNGNANKKDTWLDIAGYATRVAQDL